MTPYPSDAQDGLRACARARAHEADSKGMCVYLCEGARVGACIAFRGVKSPRVARTCLGSAISFFLRNPLLTWGDSCNLRRQSRSGGMSDERM